MSASQSRHACARFTVEGLEPRMLLSATQLDPTFAAGGVFQLGTVGHASQGVEDEAVQPDGKILTLGDVHGDGISSIVVRRFNPNGSVDTTFGSGGAAVITDPADANNLSGAAMSLGPDGKIAVLGNDGSQLLIARLLPGGVLDSGFALSGIVTFTTLQANSTYLGPRAVMLTADDKITYTAVNETYQEGQIGRFNADGTPDSTVGTNGVFAVASPRFEAWALMALPNGQFLAAGTSGGIAVSKFNQDGTLDSAFGTSGVASIRLSNGLVYQEARAIAVQGDGKIVVAGRTGSFQYEGSDFAEIVRFNADGSPDTSFGTNGGSVLSYPTARGATILPTGKIAVATDAPTSVTSSGIELMMLTGSGQLDTTFNSTGVVDPGLLGFGSAEKEIGLAQSQGLPVLVADDTQDNLVLVRYGSTGAADASFGQSGRATVVATAPGKDEATLIQPTPDGGVLVSGSTARDGNMLLKLTSSGSPDSTFANAGILSLAYMPTALSLLPDGRIDVAERGPNASSTILRLNTNGTPDTTWGTNGVASCSISIASLATDPTTDGLVVAGSSYTGQGQIQRLTPAGALDTSFATQSTTPGTFLEYSGQFYAAAVQPDGKIVAAGNPTGAFSLVRLNPNGTLDTTFGTNGTESIGSGGQASQMMLMSDGRILAAGIQSLQTAYTWTVARFLANGSLDPTFHGSGIFQMDNAGGVTALQLQENAKILLAGTIYSGVAWARLNSDGSFDTAFGNDGEYAWGAISGWKTNPALAEDSAGRIVTAGSVYSSDAGHDLIVARLETGTRGNLTGTVFNDINNNGFQDAAETGLAGVSVYLDANNNGRLDPGEVSVTTDASGNYTFNNVLQETWMVRQVAPAGYAQTAPLGYGAAVTIREGQTVKAPAFGDVNVSSVTMNLAYLLLLTRNFGQPATFAGGDLNGDGTVNLADFLLLARDFGKPISPAALSPAAGYSLAPRAVRRTR